MAAEVVRVVLFLVVLGGGMMASQYRMAGDGSLAELHKDLGEGRVGAVEYLYEVRGGRYWLDVRWSTGPFSWSEFNEGGGLEVPRMIEEAFPEEYGTPLQGHTFERDLRAAIGDRDVDVRVLTDTRPRDRFLGWVVPFGWFSVVYGAAYLAMFGVMLRRGGHRFANRWAWTWLFLTSPVGVLAYLGLERRPFAPDLPARAKPPVGGTVGFLLAVLAPVAFSLLALAF
ncbi:hypothetical protein [Actinocorallia sp. A-T 12471]|uniref:hypothetical protein n=1 Tax=Actinocorallia sp. A-T 12471 TaxID=3089813 RepID=UPI0029CF4F8F|nr:hypothetical protein [Actinocorallia sp. A-T 12471]MDX6744007.1 hypothetical protein [Actinocorallia sp. A-T 12471]